jgi:hypothetical protein
VVCSIFLLQNMLGKIVYLWSVSMATLPHYYLPTIEMTKRIGLDGK